MLLLHPTMTPPLVDLPSPPSPEFLARSPHRAPAPIRCGSESAGLRMQRSRLWFVTAMCLLVGEAAAAPAPAVEARIALRTAAAQRWVAIDVYDVSSGGELDAFKLRLRPNHSTMFNDIVLLRAEQGRWARSYIYLRRDKGDLMVFVSSAAPLQSGRAKRSCVLTLVLGFETSFEVTEPGDVVEALQIVEAVDHGGLPLYPSLTTELTVEDAEDGTALPIPLSLCEYGTENGGHSLRFYVPNRAIVRVTLADERGETLGELLNREVGPGVHAIYRPKDLPLCALAGEYPSFVHLEMGGAVLDMRIGTAPLPSPSPERYQSLERERRVVPCPSIPTSLSHQSHRIAQTEKAPPVGEPSFAQEPSR